MDQPTTDSVLRSWPAHVVTAVVTGVVTTYVPVQRWSRPARWALHGGMGALAAGAVAIGLRNPGVLQDPSQQDERSEVPPPRLGPAPTAALALALGATVAGASRGGQAADSWAERRLAARGVRRPRLWMGAGAAVASLAMSLTDDRRPAVRAPVPTSHRS